MSMDCEPLNDLAKFYNNRTILPPELKTLYRSEHWATQQHQHLDSIKWYKDGQEFYRLLPSGNHADNEKYFLTSGVKLDNQSKELKLGFGYGEHRITLTSTDLNTSGEYRCQITESQAPFHTEQRDGTLNVIIRPDDRSPIMEVHPKVAHIDQKVHLKCSSSRSKPAAKLSFYINGERIPEAKMSTQDIITEEDGLLESSHRSMTFDIQESHYRHSPELEVKCNAKIGDAYWKSRTQKIKLDGIPSYMLESRSNANTEVSVLNWLVILYLFYI